MTSDTDPLTHTSAVFSPEQLLRLRSYGTQHDLDAGQILYQPGDPGYDLILVDRGAAFGPNVNLVVCPMLQKPWLQKGTSVANPYFGKAMLTCGNIKKP